MKGNSLLRRAAAAAMALVMTLACLPLQTAGAGAAGPCALTLSYQYGEKPVRGLEITLRKAAGTDFRLTEAFAGSGVVLDTELSAGEQQEAADRLADWASENDIGADRTGTTDEDGRLVFPGLEPAVWLVTGRPLAVKHADPESGYEKNTAYVPQNFFAVVTGDLEGEPKLEAVELPFLDSFAYSGGVNPQMGSRTKRVLESADTTVTDEVYLEGLEPGEKYELKSVILNDTWDFGYPVPALFNGKSMRENYGSELGTLAERLVMDVFDAWGIPWKGGAAAVSAAEDSGDLLEDVPEWVPQGMWFTLPAVISQKKIAALRENAEYRELLGMIAFAETEFTAGSGKVTTVSTKFEHLNTLNKGGQDLRVFQILTKGNWIIATEILAEYERETVHVWNPELDSRASAEGSRSAFAGENVTLKDTVSFRNLVPGEYRLTGQLMLQSTEKPLEVNGAPVPPAESTFSLTEETEEYAAEQTFPAIDARQLAGRSAVVFETLEWREDEGKDWQEVASHRNILDGDQTVTFLPPPEGTGGLTVSKQVTGSGADREWHFAVELDPKVPDGTYGEMTFTDGRAEFVLKRGESRSASGIPAGTRYAVTEAEAGQDGMQTASSGSRGVITAGGNDEAAVTFENRIPEEKPETGDLTVSKQVAGKGDVRRDWNFRVDLDPPLNGTYGEMTFADGRAEFALKHGESRTASGLPAGTAWKVTELDAGQDGYTVTPEGGSLSGTVKSGETGTAAFVNSLGDQQKTEESPGDGHSTKIGDEITYRIDWTNSGSGESAVTVTDRLDPGVDFVSASAGDAVLNAAGERTVLSWIRDVLGLGAGSSRAEGTVTLTGPGGETETEVTVAYDAEAHAVTWTFGSVPPGAGGSALLTVRVNERAAEKWEHSENGELTGSPDETDSRVSNRALVTGNDFSQETNTVTNPLGSLSVSKTVAGDGDRMKNWHFRVELSDRTVSGRYGDMVFNEGVSEFLLKHGERKTAAGLPPGVQYTVTEREDGQNGCITEKHGEAGLIPESGMAEAEFVNTLPETPPPEEETGGLSVTKTVEGSDADRTREWHFRVELGDRTVSGTYGDMVFNEGVSEFTLKHGEKKTAEGLPPGVSYTVTEQEADLEGWKTSSTGETGTVPAGAEAQAEFVNTAGPSKEELTPGEGEEVLPGDEIVYEITWRNDRETEAEIDVYDPLDEGFDFVSADSGGTYDPGSRTVSWHLGKHPAGASGQVTLTVRVNETARENGHVANQASVEVDHSPRYTNRVENPDGSPEKEETAPGEGQPVKPGDEITYTVSWENYEKEPADVTVTDWLDPGVDFVSAESGSVRLEAGDGSVSEGDVTIRCDGESRTVVWVLRNRPAGEKGRVTLTVRVNEKAPSNGLVGNQAGVKVGNRFEQKTNVVENPNPSKTETEVDGEAPGPGGLVPDGDGQYSGPRVHVGSEIEYTIYWNSTEDTAADVTIRDPLDPCVDFVSASDGGVYDPAVHTVTWSLKNMPAGSSGSVTLTVRVNEKAEDSLMVENAAWVQVGNRPEVETDTVVNEFGPRKEEVSPGNGVMTGVGEEITFRIHWQNWNSEPASVLVRDRLDPGVDFVSADSGGIYDSSTHTVNWDLGVREAWETGSVTLTVRVNEKAYQTWTYEEPSLGPDRDWKIVDRAQVKAGHDPWRDTDLVENPVPEKTETEISGRDVSVHVSDNGTVTGPAVSEGDTVTYAIGWSNGRNRTATVTVTDRLDPGVDFVQALFGDAVLNAGTRTVTAGGVTITYDSETREVTWTLRSRPAGDSGEVTLTVRVNATAVEQAKVENRAEVEIENESRQTVTVENPAKPDTPDTPDTPDNPDTPDTPDKPDTPSRPSSPGTPGRPGNPGVPQTGDTSNRALWTVLLVLSAAGILVLALPLFRKRSRK